MVYLSHFPPALACKTHVGLRGEGGVGDRTIEHLRLKVEHILVARATLVRYAHTHKLYD